ARGLRSYSNHSKQSAPANFQTFHRARARKGITYVIGPRRYEVDPSIPFGWMQAHMVALKSACGVPLSAPSKPRPRASAASTECINCNAHNITLWQMNSYTLVVGRHLRQ